MPAYYGWAVWDYDEERHLKDSEVWVIDAKDCIPALCPFETYLMAVCAHLAETYATETLSAPMGIPDWRSKDGFHYLSRIKLSEEEKKRREPIFRERITPWIEDFGREWRGKFLPELEQGFQQLKKVDVERLSDIELRLHFEDWLSYNKRNWYIHMLCLYAGWHIYGLFEDICKQLLGIDEQHPQFKALMSGFDNRIFQVDRGLYLLGGRAIELGLGTLFETIKDDEKLLSELEKNTKGREWLKELREFLAENGWRSSTGRVFDVSTPTWVEKPSLALPNIRLAIAKGGVFVLDQERERLARQREEVEKQVLARVPVDKRGMFEKLLRAAQWVGRWAEEHLFYCEFYTNGLGRRVVKETGKRFARTAVLEEPEDIYFLFPEEVIFHIVPAGFGKFSPWKLVRIRKEQYQQNLKAQPPFFLGDVSKVGEVVRDEVILLRVLAGVPVVRPELKADLYGSNSAPGVAEGPARVIMSHEEFHLVQPGEILVTIATSPIWTPLFAIAKGVVTDTGGGLIHAIIVGREFGLPVVAGTIEGTKRIKTGQRIRVDGENCCVYILDKE